MNRMVVVLYENHVFSIIGTDEPGDIVYELPDSGNCIHEENKMLTIYNTDCEKCDNLKNKVVMQPPQEYVSFIQGNLCYLQDVDNFIETNERGFEATIDILLDNVHLFGTYITYDKGKYSYIVPYIPNIIASIDWTTVPKKYYKKLVELFHVYKINKHGTFRYNVMKCCKTLIKKIVENCDGVIDIYPLLKYINGYNTVENLREYHQQGFISTRNFCKLLSKYCGINAYNYISQSEAELICANYDGAHDFIREYLENKNGSDICVDYLSVKHKYKISLLEDTTRDLREIVHVLINMFDDTSVIDNIAVKTGYSIEYIKKIINQH